MDILDRTHWWRSVAASHEKKRGKFDRPLVLAAAVLLLLLSGISVAADTQEIPVVNGGLGPCSVDFTVEDGSHKPLYDAKINVTIRYGFLSKRRTDLEVGDRKSTRLNSSHLVISYAVFCLKKKKTRILYSLYCYICDLC